ncbi:MAG: Gfo/Idh/MocA family protein [Bacteriovoracaceae bacterium]
MKINVVLIGLGNIGKRHLQALGNLENLQNLYCYDLFTSQLDATKDFIQANSIKLNKVYFFDSLEETLKAIDKNTIVIVATTVKDRFEILKQVIEQSPKAILAEKALCSNQVQYEDLIKLSRKSSIPIYINLARRAYPFYQKLKKELEGKRITGFYTTFPGGAACSGIHIFDLLFWLSGASGFSQLNSLSADVYETKRPGFYDIACDFQVQVDDFMASINATKEDDRYCIEFTTENEFIKIFESGKKVYTFNSHGIIKEESFEIPFTSQLSDKIIKDILNGKEVRVPDIFEAQLGHRLLFDFMNQNNIRISFT